MMLGVVIPVVLLTGFEIYYAQNRSGNPDYDNYRTNQLSSNVEPQTNSEVQTTDNDYSKKVLMIGVLAIGILLVVLSALSKSANTETFIVGISIALPSLWLLLKIK